jgi:hypothetical protein
VNSTKTFLRVHSIQRIFERNISVKRVLQALQSGETIEDYSTEMAEPSYLILGFQGKHPFHVVASENPTENRITIITVYRPDPAKWNKNFKSRRS